MANLALLKILRPNSGFLTPEARDAWLMNLITTGELVKPGAPTLNSQALDVIMDLYSELVEEIGPKRFSESYTYVLNTSNFRPDISEIRKAAGAIPLSPAAKNDAEAMLHFEKLLICMRIHGPLLKPSPGKVIRDRDDQGLVLVMPIREPPRPCPTPPPHVDAAIVAMGLGDREAGLETIAAHPTLPWNKHRGAADYRAKNAADLEKRWVQLYRQAMDSK